VLESAIWAAPGPLVATPDRQGLVCSGGDRGMRLGSRQRESNGTETGECAVCRGRFSLVRARLVPSHRLAAPLHERPIYVGLSL